MDASSKENIDSTILACLIKHRELSLLLFQGATVSPPNMLIARRSSLSREEACLPSSISAMTMLSYLLLLLPDDDFCVLSRRSLLAYQSWSQLLGHYEVRMTEQRIERIDYLPQIQIQGSDLDAVESPRYVMVMLHLAIG